MHRKASFDPAYFAPLAAVEDRHFWFRARNRAIEALLEGIAARLGPGSRVLEVGCGTGNVLRVLEKTCRGAMVVGVDAFREGLHFARRRTGCPLVQADSRALPFCGSFDLIGLFDVLEHQADDAAALRDLRGLLRPGGALLLTVPAAPSLWSSFDEAAGHHRRYRASELEQKLVAAGYEVQHLTPYMTAIFPIMWLARRAAGNLVARDLRVIPILNGVLGALLAPEPMWIRRQRRLPFGASLLAVARRPAT